MEENKNVWILVFVAVALLFLFGSFGMGYGMMGYGMGFGFIFMLLFWGAIIWFIMTMINTRSSKKEEDAMAILKRRYASGKITKKQYEEMRRELIR